MIERTKRARRLKRIITEFGINRQSAINFMLNCIELAKHKKISYEEAYNQAKEVLNSFIKCSENAEKLAKLAIKLGKTTLKTNQ